MDKKVSSASFKAFLLANDLKQKEVADYLGVSAPFITHIMNGARPLPEDKLGLLYDKEEWDTSMLRPSVSQTVNAPMTVGRDNNVGASSPSPDIQKALDEIAEQRKLVAKSQEQIDRLLTLLERYGK